MKSSASIILNKPIQEVFAFISDFNNMHRWVSGVTDPRAISGGEIRVGTEFATKYQYNGVHDITYVVTDYDRPTRYGCKATSGPFPFESLIELETTSSGTKITNTIDAGADGRVTAIIFALFGPLLRKAMHKRLRKELEGLKDLLESQVAV